jgi:plastocyanin
VTDSTHSATVTRRGFLRGATATAALAGGVGGASTAVAQEGGGGNGGGGQTHTVEMTDQLAYLPSALSIAPGDTVTWVNVGSMGHSVTAYEEEIPEGAAYFASGDFESEEAARGGYPEGDIPAGDEYSYQFDVEGEYRYFCIPHESAGMVASIAVGEAVAADADGSVAEPGGASGAGGVSGPTVPESALSLGVATAMAMSSVLALAYLFLKYGGDYEGADGPTPRRRRPSRR